MLPMLTVHYRRDLGDYDNWCLRIRTNEQYYTLEQVREQRYTSFGAVFRIDDTNLQFAGRLFLQPQFSASEIVDGEERLIDVSTLGSFRSHAHLFLAQGERTVNSIPSQFHTGKRTRFLVALISAQSTPTNSTSDVDEKPLDPWLVARDDAGTFHEFFPAVHLLRKHFGVHSHVCCVVDSSHFVGERVLLTVCSQSASLSTPPSRVDAVWTPSDGSNFAELNFISGSYSATFCDASTEALKLLLRESDFIPGESKVHCEPLMKPGVIPGESIELASIDKRDVSATEEFLSTKLKPIKLYYRRLDRATPFYSLKVCSVSDPTISWNVQRQKMLYRESALFFIHVQSLSAESLAQGLTLNLIHVDTKKSGAKPVIWRPESGYYVVLAESFDGLLAPKIIDVLVEYHRFDDCADWKQWELRVWTNSEGEGRSVSVKARPHVQPGAMTFDLTGALFRKGSVVHAQPVKIVTKPNEWKTGNNGEQYLVHGQTEVVCRDVVRTWISGELELSKAYLLQGNSICLPAAPDRSSVLSTRFIRLRYMRYSVGGYEGWDLWTWEDYEDASLKLAIAPELVTDSIDWVEFVIDRAKYGAGIEIGFVPRLGGEAWEDRDDPPRLWKASMLEEVPSSTVSEASSEKKTLSIVQGTDLVLKDLNDARTMLSAEMNQKGEIIISSQVPFDWFAPLGSKLGIIDVRIELMSRKVTLSDKVIPKLKKRLSTDQVELITPIRLRCTLKTEDLLDEDFLVERTRVLIPGFEQAVLRWQYHANPDKYSYSGCLGATYSERQTVFRCFAPTADSVSVVLYDRPHGNQGRNVVPMRRIPEGCWKAIVREDLKGRFYKLLTEGTDKLLFPGVEVIDPYSRCNTSHSGRGLIFGYENTSIAPRPDIPIEDVIVYELHIRDATIDENSGVKNRGKYTGLTERGTRLQHENLRNSNTQLPSASQNRTDASSALVSEPGNVLEKYSTCLDHIIQMGITAVQIMPVQDFDNDETNENAYRWGYMPVHFNSPDGWYASSVTTVARVTELKCLVDAFHKVGIKVIMDVVYNHTAEDSNEKNLDARFSFNGLVPRYYYRTCGNTPTAYSGDSTCGRPKPGKSICGACYSNGSGCGNEFRSESPMGRKFIIDSLVYWATEYQVDGFRFDLLGLIDLETISEATRILHDIDPNIVVYGEPWCGGLTPIKMTDKGSQRSRGFAVFNNSLRDAIRGSPFDAEETFVMDGGRLDEVKRGIIGSIDEFCDSPMETINYVECHDNYTLWDHMQFYIKSRTDDIVFTDEDVRRMHVLSAIIVLTSQGIPFIQIGQEMCRSKFGVENSYESPDEINMVRWEKKISEWKTVQYYKGLIQLRREHPEMFALGDRDTIRSRVTFYEDLALDLPGRCIGFQIEGDAVRLCEALKKNSEHDSEAALAEEVAKWSVLVVLLNPTPQEVNFPLPDHENDSVWIQLVDDKYAGVEQICGPVVGGISVAGRSGAILRKASASEHEKAKVYLRLACVSDTYAVPGGDDRLSEYSVSLSANRSAEEFRVHGELRARREQFMSSAS